MKDIYYDFKLVLNQGGKVFGEGPAKLLENINETGSLRKAAQGINMSYSQAHNLLKTLSANLGYPLLITKTGGATGGGTHLTPEAEELLKNYREFSDDCEIFTDKAFKRYFGQDNLLNELNLPNKAVISIIGGGGKTSLMWQLGYILSRKGKKVVLGTTTKIGVPAKGEGDYFLITEEPQAMQNFVRDTMQAGDLTIIAPRLWKGKIDSLNEEQIEAIGEVADYVILEADGSNRLPIKAPASHEPVIYAKSDVIIGVFGAEVIDKPADETICHRLAEFLSVTELNKGGIIDEIALAKLVNSKQGMQKGVPDGTKFVLCINKADQVDKNRLDEVANYLIDSGVEKILTTTLNRPRLVRRVYEKTQNLTAVILAGGTSSRMGENKLRLPLLEKTVLETTLEKVEKAGFKEIILVTGHEALHWDFLATKSNVKIVYNENYLLGQGTSLACAVEYIDENCSGAMFLMADQPAFEIETIELLIENFKDETQIIAPYLGEKRGNPVILGRKYFAEIAMLKADMGAREILKQNVENLVQVQVDDVGIFLDVDTKEAYREAVNYVSIN